MAKSKTYYKTIFSGKRIPAGAMDQGNGPLYRGDSVDFLLNAEHDGALKMRQGHGRIEFFDEGTIRQGHCGTVRGVCSSDAIYGGSK